MQEFDRIKDGVRLEIIEHIKNKWNLDLSNYECKFYDEDNSRTGYDCQCIFTQAINTIYVEDIMLDFKGKITYLGKVILGH